MDVVAKYVILIFASHCPALRGFVFLRFSAGTPSFRVLDSFGLLNRQIKILQLSPLLSVLDPYRVQTLVTSGHHSLSNSFAESSNVSLTLKRQMRFSSGVSFCGSIEIGGGHKDIKRCQNVEVRVKMLKCQNVDVHSDVKAAASKKVC
jgi:hypothetical protein